MSHLVKIIDKEHPLHGQEVPGDVFFYDYLYTGNSPDLYQVTAAEKRYRLLSTQIDEEHYNAQLRAEFIAKLGANEGDMVIIQKGGSGCFCGGWDASAPHKITKISHTGTVEFDGGSKTGASIFRPEVNLVN